MELMDNPKFAAFIAQFTALMEDTQKVSLEEARKQSSAFFSPPSLPKEGVQSISDIKIKGEEGNEIPVRLYTPATNKNLPLFIYYHRGGWVFSNIEEADGMCRKLANHLGCIVASVDYRLAPENPFPKPLNDCYDAFCWIAEHAAELGGDPEKIIVGGESAGGNLAAAVALRAREQLAPAIAVQLLIYPLISSTLHEETYRESKDQFFITKEAMAFFWNMYLQNPADRDNPYASPDKATYLGGLPPALVVTAEHDPLHQEGENYGQLLIKAGNEVVLERFPGVIHGFLDLPIYTDEEIVAWIKKIKLHLHYLLTAYQIA